jgi:hypothetical protein
VEKALIKRLVLPLTTLFVLALAIHAAWDWDGFLLSLAVQLLGILITVAYVDYILRVHEASKQAPANRRLRDRLHRFVNAAFTECRGAIGFGSDIVNFEVLSDPTHAKVRKEMERVAREVVLPEIEIRISMLDEIQWRKLASATNTITENVDRFLQLFGDRLQPEVLAALLDIQDAASSIFSYYHLVPDILGVSDERLPKRQSGESTKDLKVFFTRRVADDLKGLIAHFLKAYSLLEIWERSDTRNAPS